MGSLLLLWPLSTGDVDIQRHNRHKCASLKWPRTTKNLRTRGANGLVDGQMMTDRQRPQQATPRKHGNLDPVENFPSREESELYRSHRVVPDPNKVPPERPVRRARGRAAREDQVLVFKIPHIISDQCYQLQ